MNDALVLLRERARRDVESGALALATFTIYETNIGHIARLFGRHFKLARLAASDVDRFIERRRNEGVVDHTIKKELGNSDRRSRLRSVRASGRATSTR